MSSRWWRPLAGALVFAACGGRALPIPPAPPPVPAAEVAASVFLIGDAGAPAPAFEPVLAALEADLARAPARSWVVFLGDNLYPRGLPDSTDPWRPEGERRLLAQIAAVRDPGARGILVPGNHDWDKGGADGWVRVRRQERFVEAHGDGRVEVLPDGGCPGPAVRDIGEQVRLILIDTQWWFHNHAKPYEPGTVCPAADSEAEVIDSLRTAVATAGERHIIVAAHHPFASGGKHGGTFGWREHLFPLRELNSALWIPLPVIGSIYPLARQSGVSPQDLSSREYRALLDSLATAYILNPPLIHAGGHDHDLQVHEGDGVVLHWALVSGSGIYGHTSGVSWIPTTRFAAEAAGYMRVDVTRQGRARLSVVIVDEEGVPREAFGTWLH